MGKIEEPKEIWRNESHFDGRDFIDYEEEPNGHTSTKYFNASLLDDPEWLEKQGYMKIPDDYKSVIKCDCGKPSGIEITFNGNKD